MKLLPFRILSTVVAVAALAACSGDSLPELLPKARTQIDQGNLSAATILLKNALEKDPASAEARFLLGKAMHLNGDPVSAEVELRKALAGGYSPDQVKALLARVLLSRGEDKKVLAEFGTETPTDPASLADLKTTVATVHARLGALDASRAALDEALRKVPDYPRGLMLQARLDASVGKHKEALALMDRVLGADPSNVDAWMVMAGLRLEAGKDPAGAMEAYRKVLALKKDHVQAASALIALHLSQNDVAAATQIYQELAKTAPAAAQTHMAAAQLAVLKGDFKTVRAHMQELLRSAPENPRLLQFAAVVELELGATAQAETLLNKAVQLAPDLVEARAVLARVYLQSGKIDKALHVLRPDSEATRGSAPLLALVGEAHLHNGDVKAAEEFLSLSIKKRPEDAKTRTALAMVQMSKGDPTAGLTQLKALSAESPEAAADLALVAIHLRNNDADGALKAIEVLDRKQPKQASVSMMRGRAHLLRGDVPAARKSFEEALALSPLHFPAVAALMTLDLGERKFDVAEKRLDALLKVDPRNGQALRALAELRIRSGAPREEILKRLTEAIRANPGDPGTRVMHVEYLMSLGELTAAESAAQDAATALPDSAEVLDALGRVQMQGGNMQRAISTFNRLPQLQPRSPVPYLRLAEAYLRSNNDAVAASNFRRALGIAPDLLIAQRGLIGLALRNKQYDNALSVARQVQKQRPTEAVGHLLEGDVRFAQKNWDAALVAFKSGLSKAGANGVPNRYHATLLAAKRDAEATQFADSWLKDHPKDAFFVKHMGDTALAKRDYATAEKRFLELQAITPGNAGVLNNIAWLMLQQKKPGAVKFAEQAVAQAPNNASLLDTLAHALVADKQAARAVATGKQALEKDPNNLGLRVSIAKVYLEAGEKALASAEADKLAEAARSNSAVRAEVDALRSALAKK
jgi:putative PEP-CTERM system TPR-repeat lipoprotein